MPIFRVKSVKIYTGQKNLHEYTRGSRDKYQVWIAIKWKCTFTAIYVQVVLVVVQGIVGLLACGTLGANLTIWPASFQRHSPQCDHQSPLRSLTLRANSSSTLPLSSFNKTKSVPTKNPHTHTDLLILVVWQRFPILQLCRLFVLNWKQTYRTI